MVRNIKDLEAQLDGLGEGDNVGHIKRSVDKAIDKAPLYKLKDFFVTLGVSFGAWMAAGIGIDFGVYAAALPACAVGVWSTWMARIIFFHLDPGSKI